MLNITCWTTVLTHDLLNWAVILFENKLVLQSTPEELSNTGVDVNSPNDGHFSSSFTLFRSFQLLSLLTAQSSWRRQDLTPFRVCSQSQLVELSRAPPSSSMHRHPMVNRSSYPATKWSYKVSPPWNQFNKSAKLAECFTTWLLFV